MCIRDRYYRIHLGTTESIFVLQMRFWYYRADFGTTESIPVLRSPRWYYGVHFGTAESIPVPQRRSWYYRIDFGTTGSSLVLADSISVVQNRHWINSGVHSKPSKPSWAGSGRQIRPKRGLRGGVLSTESGAEMGRMKNRRVRGSKKMSPILPKLVSSGPSSQMFVFCNWE